MTSAPFPTDRLASAFAGRYRIERELGAGGMATVYLAADLTHDRKVAIKVLKPELAAVLGAERFAVEIRTTASLQHPHILPLFDSGTADGLPFYVMPYVQGETIRQKLDRETQFGIDEAIRIGREVADALDYAHRHGIVHAHSLCSSFAADGVRGDAFLRDPHRLNHPAIVESQLVDADDAMIAIRFTERTTMVDDVPLPGRRL